MTRRKLLLLCMAFAMCLPAAAEDARRDGNWWRTRDRASKLSYVTGLLDGMELGNHLSFWGLPEKGGPVNPAMLAAVAAYDKLVAQYFNDVSAGELAVGLNMFYEDEINRAISITDAIWLVANSISGKSDLEMRSLIDGFRKNAK